MPTDHPSVVVIAGPNGAGKSTLAARLLRDAFTVDAFVNADDIAADLGDPHSESAAIAAGRIMLTRLDELEAARASFAFETTLASRTFAPRLRRLAAAGYSTYLVFYWLPSVDLAVGRVAARVAGGGHSVPEAVIRRRYARGLRNLFAVYMPIVHAWRVYDSSPDSPVIVASSHASQRPAIACPIEWKAIRAGGQL